MTSSSQSFFSSAKLNPPAGNAMQIIRNALCMRVRDARHAKLVIIQAPAGFGKTTLLAQCRSALSANGVETGWLTLDQADNDLPRFFACLAAVVSRIVIGGKTYATLADVLQQLDGLESPFALFFDDFELIQEPGIIELFQDAIEHLPRNGQILIATRTMPPLRLGRLRAHGQLLEIGTRDMRFSLAETTAFFQQHRPDLLSSEQLSRLHTRTEGWITALYLATIALNRHSQPSDFIEHFSGSDHVIATYLAEDVLDHQSPEVRRFLLRTSIVRDLNLPLSQALNPNLDCQRILDDIAHSNLFLVPISEDEPVWRYHSLFADFLRARLAKELPGEIRELQLLASLWYESVHRIVPAIDHALEGQHLERAMELLAAHGMQFLQQGRMRLLSRWFSAIPDRVLSGSPYLQVMDIWSACFTVGPWEAMARLDRSQCRDSGDPRVCAHVSAQLPLMLAMQDRYEEALVVGRESLSRLPSNDPFADSVMSNAMANVMSVMGEYAEARRLLDHARRTLGGSEFIRMYSETMEGILDLQAGRLRQAGARFRIAVDATPGGSYNGMHGNAWAGVLYTGTLYETGNLPMAEQLLNVYLPIARDVGLPDHMIESHLLRTRIAYLQGDIDFAFETLTELEYIGHQRQLPRVVASAKLERARILFLQQKADAAKAELDHADDPVLWKRVRALRLPGHDLDDIVIGRVRWHISYGDAAWATQKLREELEHALAAGRHRRALKLRVLLALAQQHGDNQDLTMTTMIEILRQCAAEGFARIVLDEGDAVAVLLQRIHNRASSSPALLSDPILSDYLRKLIDSTEPQPMDASNAGDAGGMPAPDQALTPRELRVLELLSQGYSNSAIAAKLFLADSTVRTHLRNINQKLSANNRTHAVAIARQMALIP
ncbi:helix-turn-helix transcriptional regulator [Alcaligenaceae bacterium]|nr:helix-turn-helix transcriptional regulator [Alcaligenaceae bacterium]